ncbi:hypothetical protein AYO49_01070 [Verrucomicrobiaceae bacterium SCGC AG-212-N21]|nr:hypothetical protein AYO49_01070 [Verrucomicrobiaceae bacterium SCGC AG-212-N21]
MAADVSGANHPGTLVNGPVWTTGRYGGGVSLDGANDQVLVAGPSTINMGTSDFTLSVWLRREAGGSEHTILSKTGNTSWTTAGKEWFISGGDNLVAFGVFGVGEVFSTGTVVNDGQWHHVAMTFQDAPNTVTFYIDGVARGGGVLNLPADNSGHVIKLGGHPAGHHFRGALDEMRIYSRALSAVEIQTDMNSPVGNPAPNTAPTITDIGDQFTLEDVALTHVDFTLGDAETAAGALLVTVGSSNPALVPVGNMQVAAHADHWSLNLAPVAHQSGSATITVTVSDGQLSASDTFVLTVMAVNDAPTLSTIANQTTEANTPTGAIPFTVGDVETAAGSLSVGGSSSNPTLVGVGGISFGGSGANRTVMVTPNPGQAGTTTITVTVSDGALSTDTSFVLTVTPAAPVNTPPTIAGLGPQTINEDTVTGPVGFTVGDAETAAASLTVSGGTSNPALVPVGNISFGGSGSSRTVSVTPVANQSGSATITVTVSDGQLTTPTNFVLTVNAVNDAPTVTAIASQTAVKNTPTAAIPFTVGDVETAAGSLSVGGSSSSQTLVGVGGISFGGSGANRTVMVMPNPGQTGTATITVTVSDGALSATSVFNLTVNDTPSGLVTGYDFDAGSGAVVEDVSGGGHVGTLVDGPVWTAGRYGGGVSLDGVDDHVLVAGPSTINLGTSDFTLSVWLRREASGSEHTILSKTDNMNWTTAGKEWFINGSSSQVAFGVFAAGEVYSTGTIENDGQWHHVAVTFQDAPNTVTFYIDGVASGGGVLDLPADNGGHLIKLGGHPAGHHMRGALDEMRIYSRALSTAEIQTDMNTPVGNPAPNTAPMIADIGGQFTPPSTSYAQAKRPKAGSNTELRPFKVSVDASLGGVTAGFSPTSSRLVGKSYSLTATPKRSPIPGGLFVGWTLGGQDVANGNATFTPERIGLTASLLQRQSINFVFLEGLELTANFIVNPYTSLAGTYDGLIQPSASLPGPEGTTRNNSTEGRIAATVQGTGAFSGTLVLDGQVLAMTGAFDDSGNARFGAERSLSQTWVRAGKPSLSVTLHLNAAENEIDPGVDDKISGTVTAMDSATGEVTAVSEVDGDRAFYNGTSRIVPAAYLGANNANGVFTVVFPAKVESEQTAGLASHAYPQGHGIGRVTITKAGVVTIAGTLADGTIVSASSRLSELGAGHANRFPMFAVLYNSMGFLSGFVAMDDTDPDSDMSATDMQWLRPFLSSSHYYPYGWPEVIKLDLMGAKYLVTSGQSVLKAPDGADADRIGDPLQPPDGDGNATLILNAGQLPRSLDGTLNIMVSDTVTRVPGTPWPFTATITRNTGTITGTFTHASGATSAYKAISYQKGTGAGAYGFFLTKRSEPIDYTGESGSVTVSGEP